MLVCVCGGGGGGGGSGTVQFDDSVLTGYDGQSNPDLIGHLESLLGCLIESRFIESVRQTIDHYAWFYVHMYVAMCLKHEIHGSNMYLRVPWYIMLTVRPIDSFIGVYSVY